MSNSKLLGNLSRGLLVIMSAPAGTGKTTLMNMLKAEFPCVRANISYTSRKPRLNEINGRDYYFISEEEFEKKIAQDDFLEYVRLYGDFYGTAKEKVEEELNKGNHVFLVIDTQGALQLKQKVDAVLIFLLPPSIEELKKRLTERKTETDEVLEKRIAWSNREVEASSQYDYRIVNDHLATAYQVLRSILIAEEHRVKI